jgi:hemerythrin-like domain-containing protein
VKKKSLELVYKTHSDGREKAIFINELILKVDKDSFYKDIQDTLKFFYKHIPLHFAYEEALIRELLKSGALSDSEASVMGKTLQEHKVLKANFEKINEMAVKMDKDFNREQKEGFLQLVTDTVGSLIKHAEYEDQFLYPIADQKTSDKLAGIIEKEISRIVY